MSAANAVNNTTINNSNYVDNRNTTIVSPNHNELNSFIYDSMEANSK
jgi:hypothetical protein